MEKRLESLRCWLATEVVSESDVDYRRLLYYPRKIYHYTTIDGLMGILQNNTLFASDALFLNDSSELVYGKQLIRDALEQIHTSSEFQSLWYGGFGEKEATLVQSVMSKIDAATVGDIYVSCFTTQSDVLSQWRGYAHNLGVRIAFDFEKLSEIFDQYLMEVDYNRKSQIKEIEQIIGILLDYCCNKDGTNLPSQDLEIVPDAIASLLLSCVCRHKSDVFKEEKEFRLVHDPVRHKNILQVHFRNNGKFIVPYVKLIPKDNKKLPIKDIMVGPSPYSEKIKSSIELLSAANGYKNLKVTLSKIPYRP